MCGRLLLAGLGDEGWVTVGVVLWCGVRQYDCSTLIGGWRMAVGDEGWRMVVGGKARQGTIRCYNNMV